MKRSLENTEQLQQRPNKIQRKWGVPILKMRIDGTTSHGPVVYQYENYRLFSRSIQKNQKGPDSFTFWPALKCLSNFYTHKDFKIQFKGVTLPSSEHVFMWNKLECAEKTYEEIRAIMAANPTPAAIKRATQKKNLKMTPYQLKLWEDGEGEDSMYRACCAKFKQNPQLAKILLATRDARLFENSPWDSKWGIGKANPDGTYSGCNQLGHVLEAVRKILRRVV